MREIVRKLKSGMLSVLIALYKAKLINFLFCSAAVMHDILDSMPDGQFKKIMPRK